MRAQQEMGTGQPIRPFGQFRRDRVLHGAVRGAVILQVRPSVADARQHAQTVGFERQSRRDATEEEDFLRPRVTDTGEPFQRLLGLRVGPLQDLLQVALELGGGDARDFLRRKL